ncbi:hypothetical protein AMS68_001303 [Peltaster fructicola]|uniref:U4/U6 snRNA-associated-splicing factor PRP24 n=1 Tax=Peltaster fructicola TaxID=286661 RepID=A0A6H0XM52_9PEZI|nr:hypothetical protein AMS68_001303 [Peltaster fructicola]
MEDVPAETPTPRTFQSSDLSEEELSTVNQLLVYLNENSYAYDSHVQLINLLHKGFLAHVATSGNDPRSYTMLPELRQAREAMDSRFAVGEALWLDWLNDETRLARSTEERVEVLELLQRATQDEPASDKLWQMYIDWVEINYATCFAVKGMDVMPMDDEDKEVCQAIFTKTLLYEVLEQAAKALHWRIDVSHAVWNRYLRFLVQHVVEQPSEDLTNAPTVQQLAQLFAERLQEPHAHPDKTVQLFWPLARELYGDRANSQMTRMQSLMQLAFEQVDIRNIHEHKLQQAIDSDDQAAILEQFNHFLKWERIHKQRAPYDKDVRAALFERALLQFPTLADLWTEYIDFVISLQPQSHNPSVSVLPLLERATKHCPWSGELWARRILRSDYERKTYVEIEALKHRATSSGLLDIGGMEDYLKVLVEWCSYLRRHAFSATADDDNKDTAEVGITMALEDMQEAGRKSYGEEFKGDPLFRLEQVQVKFLCEARRMRDARDVWRNLVSSKKHFADFWLKYYNFELTLWIHDRVNDGKRIETTETGPQLATAVVEEALSQYGLDWPDKIADMYMDHFQHHESVEKVQSATIAVWEFRRKVALKRAREAEAAARQQTESILQQRAHHEAATMQQLEEVPAQAQHQAEGEVQPGEKRKRDREGEEEGDNKKAKTEDIVEQEVPAARQKRDRENLSITLGNLTPETTEEDIRTFLRGCGPILSIAITPHDGQTMSATVAFEQPEDIDFAKSRQGWPINGNEVHIRKATQSTLYVANYPPAFDETSIRKLFSSYGEITGVRFPSLKFNNRRRFCYVQFVSHQQAKAAETAMDGKKLDGFHRLVAKISDPDAKKQRGGPQAEKRELFIKNIDSSASEEEVKEFFMQYGKVESVHLLKSIVNHRLGGGFIVYSTAEEAQKAIDEADGKPFRDRILQVTLSTPKGGAAPEEQAAKQDIIVKHDSLANGDRRGSDVSMLSASSHDPPSHMTVRERQVALFDVPDTVTDARIIEEMEKHGRIVKLQLRREQHAAIVEFENVKAAFEVRVGIDFPSLGPECKSGEPNALFNQHKAPQTSRAGLMRPNTISRPVQRGARRGGLGFRRGGSTDRAAHGNAKPARSNADFKAMFEQGKKSEQAE